MASIFCQLFACCLRGEPNALLDEERPLLLPHSDFHSPWDTANGEPDSHSTKERLNGIVRSKEGKMVNVLSAVPFNLRNEPLSRNRASSSGSNHSDSTSRDQTTLFTNRSYSTSSLDRDFSYGNLREEGEVKPILNARIVGSARRSRRGFDPRDRLGRFEEARGAMGYGARGRTERTGDEQDFVHMNGNGHLTPVGERPEVTPLNDEDLEMITSLSNELSVSMEEGSKIHDVGSISRGWGD